MTLGERIAASRHQQGITKRALARRTNISESALYGIERGTILSPRFYVVVALAEALGLSLESLAIDVPSPTKRPYGRGDTHA